MENAMQQDGAQPTPNSQLSILNSQLPLVYQLCNFFYTVHCTDGVEVNTGYSMFH